MMQLTVYLLVSELVCLYLSVFIHRELNFFYLDLRINEIKVTVMTSWNTGYISWHWMILCQYLASELTAEILLTRVRTTWDL